MSGPSPELMGRNSRWEAQWSELGYPMEVQKWINPTQPNRSYLHLFFFRGTNAYNHPTDYGMKVEMPSPFNPGSFQTVLDKVMAKIATWGGDQTRCRDRVARQLALVLSPRPALSPVPPVAPVDPFAPPTEAERKQALKELEEL